MPESPAELRPMTDQEICEVFAALQLPAEPMPEPVQVARESVPVIFFPITGDSPPLAPGASSTGVDIVINGA